MGGVQSSGHGGVVTHQLVSQTSLHTGVNSGPGHRGSVQLETLRRQDRVSATKQIHSLLLNLLRLSFFSLPFSVTLTFFRIIII